MDHTLYWSLGPSLFQGSGLFFLSQLWMKQMSAEMNEACMIKLNTTIARTSEHSALFFSPSCLGQGMKNHKSDSITINNNRSSIKKRHQALYHLLWETESVSNGEQMLTIHLGYARPGEPDMSETWCIHRQWKKIVGSTMMRGGKKQNKNKYKASQMTWRWCKLCNKLRKHGSRPSSLVVHNWFCFRTYILLYINRQPKILFIVHKQITFPKLYYRPPVENHKSRLHSNDWHYCYIKRFTNFASWNTKKP